ncbi:HlyD family secretion protein [Myxococcus vastator]|uniref:HlyD family secretion protein n=1 Tax=Myxococcus vastator TaxID=2709664 RepID=UPI0013D89121|nr:HlyD family efflux transporter periplasmic adaptor subunit [Myxococcus vastator]
MGLILLALVALGIRQWTLAGTERTDDATVIGDIIPLNARVGGEIARIVVEEHQHVAKGEVLLQVDEHALALEVERAEAHLARIEAESRVTHAKTQPVATLEAREDEGEDERDSALASARVREARHGLSLARSRRAQARLIAPQEGTISKLMVREGQLIEEGRTLMLLSLPPTIVVANFKETRIRYIRPGLRATIHLDAYPEQPLKGTVLSVAAGTGASFSIFPPTNASGNFVKVVQRISTRIALDDPSRVPLKAGLSAEVIIHTQ